MSGGMLRGLSWIDGEVDVSAFSDAWLGARFRDLLLQLSCSIGEPIPLACRDWANAKAAYRFFSNPSVREDQILAGHFEATRARVAAIGGWVLVLQDTTVFGFEGAAASQPLPAGNGLRASSSRRQGGLRSGPMRRRNSTPCRTSSKPCIRRPATHTSRWPTSRRRR